MRKGTIKLRNLYTVHDKEDKAIALILAKDLPEAKQIWQDRNNHEQLFFDASILKNVHIKELQKAFRIQKLTCVLSEKNMGPGKSLLCTKLSRYYTH